MKNIPCNMIPFLPIVSVDMAESLRSLGFSDATPFYYLKGELKDVKEQPPF